MSNKVILLCGKIASGKSYYARHLAKTLPAVNLSCDDLMLTLFGGDAGERHDLLASRAQTYLFHLSLELLAAGQDVILDWGFWTKQHRDAARTFYERNGISTELHYIDIDDTLWRAQIRQRNAAVTDGSVQAYFVDEGLLAKLESRFEIPDAAEVDVYHRRTEAMDEPTKQRHF